MSTKDEVLELLKYSGSKYISGQEMASGLYVTRAAVWKAIKALQAEGHIIEAVTNKGYRLVTKGELLSESRIVTNVSEDMSFLCSPDFVKVYDEVESTNDLARQISLSGDENEHVIVASSQTKGRGRRGRDFFSPEGTGLYMSFLIYPKEDITEAIKYTCMMAESLCRAIEKVIEVEASIKWVNDIYYKDKKVAGILTEAITSVEDGSLSSVIIGVGINVFNPYEGFPENIKNKAGALLEQHRDDVMNRLCGAIITEFYRSYMKPLKYPFLEGYKKRSILIGNYIKIISNSTKNIKSGREYALVTGIDDQCHLLIRYDDGVEDSLFSGEVSVVKY